MSSAINSGHCYCGAVRFEVSGDPIWIGHCHCDSCRRASGSVMTTLASYNTDQVEFTGTLPVSEANHPSNDGVIRSFCGKCGSPVAYGPNGNVINLQLGLFNDPLQLKPQKHFFYDNKVDWLKADEHLPK
jgi:hypothetical protein